MRIRNFEECWTLVGTRQDTVWRARVARYCAGDPSTVEADGAWTLAREERVGDVVGFIHTHPMGGERPSRRDVRTMRAWCECLGKPLLCLIRTPTALVAYRFDSGRSFGRRVARLALLDRRNLSRFVIREGQRHGRSVSSPAALSR